MKSSVCRGIVYLCALSLLRLSLAQAATDAPPLNVYVNDSCIVADEAYFIPAQSKDGSDVMVPKFLPLIGLVIGKLVEMFINAEFQGGANAIKAKGARKDTRYALRREMNLYRADLTQAPILSINARLGCMTIVAAKLKPPGTVCTADYIPKTLTRESMPLPVEQWKTSRTDNSVENQLRRANICVDGKADAVYEARFEFSPDGTAYRLRDAGYRVNSLLTTQDKGAARSVVYTLKVLQPGTTDQEELLSSAYVNLGTLTAGAQSNVARGENAPWLRVPPLNAEARRAFDEKTHDQQDVSGQIEALKRAMTRNQRMRDGLDVRLRDASADLAPGLQQARTKVAVDLETQSVELDALKAEYHDLPNAPLEFMPVTIEVAVTETESEKKLQLALAAIIGDNSAFVASNIGGAAATALSKSVSTSDLVLDNDRSDPQATLSQARARYFDALVATKGTNVTAAAQTELLTAKQQYNEARHSLGLEPLP